MDKEYQGINYSWLGRAMEYYADIGYSPFEAKWMVDSYISMQTNPSEHGAFIVTNGNGHYKHLVGSAEQSFMEEVWKGKMTPQKLYVSCTPCFRRGDTFGSRHQETFMKVELSYYSYDPNDLTYLWTLIDDAENFFINELGMKTVKREKDYDRGYDDLFANDKEIDDLYIELGSYGMRELIDGKGRTYYSHYGTGLALPRAQFAL